MNFTSQVFNDYCRSIEIYFEHHLTHIHTQNGLIELFIKRLQMIARLSRMKTKLMIYAWRHITCCIFSSHYSKTNIFYLRISGYAVYIPIASSQCNKMGPQHRLGIYIALYFPSIIGYLEFLTSDFFFFFFKSPFEDCHFNEIVFSLLGGE